MFTKREVSNPIISSDAMLKDKMKNAIAELQNDKKFVSVVAHQDESKRSDILSSISTAFSSISTVFSNASISELQQNINAIRDLLNTGGKQGKFDKAYITDIENRASLINQYGQLRPARSLLADVRLKLEKNSSLTRNFVRNSDLS